jgi:predicted nucleic acid-binding protein
LLSHAGPPGKLVDAIETGLLVPVFSEPILFEYLNVLLRPKFGFEMERIIVLMEALYLSGIPVDELEIGASGFNDVHDVPFYAAAMLENSVLITGNLKHYPLDRPVEVLSPRLALDKLEELS